MSGSPQPASDRGPYHIALWAIDVSAVLRAGIANSRRRPMGSLTKDLRSTQWNFRQRRDKVALFRLTAADSVTLGRTVPFSWPPELTTSIRIGRLTENDIVLDDARVSGHHARLIVVAGFRHLDLKGPRFLERDVSEFASGYTRVTPPTFYAGVAY